MTSIMLRIVGALAFIAAMCLASMPVYSGDGVVVMQREVPPHPAYRESPPGHAVTADVSPDDKVRAAVGGQSGNLQDMELGDGDFASVTSGSPLALSSPAEAMNKAAISEARLGHSSLNGVGGASASAQSIAPVMTGTIGPAVGAATNALIGTTGTLNGLTGAILRTSGQ